MSLQPASLCLKVRAHGGGEGSGYTNASWLPEDTHAHASSPTVSPRLSFSFPLTHPCELMPFYESEALPRPCVIVPLQPANSLLSVSWKITSLQK